MKSHVPTTPAIELSLNGSYRAACVFRRSYSLFTIDRGRSLVYVAGDERRSVFLFRTKCVRADAKRPLLALVSRSALTCWTSMYDKRTYRQRRSTAKNVPFQQPSCPFTIINEQICSETARILLREPQPPVKLRRYRDVDESV